MSPPSIDERAIMQAALTWQQRQIIISSVITAVTALLLTSDEFYECTVEVGVAERREERARVEREGRAAILAEWKVAQEGRTEIIKKRRAEWELEKKQWAVDKAAAKVAGKRFTEPAPRLGKLPAAIPRPKMTATMYNDDDDDDERAISQQIQPVFDNLRHVFHLAKKRLLSLGLDNQ